MITKSEPKKAVNEKKTNNESVSNENQESKKWYQFLSFQNLEMKQSNECFNDSDEEEISVFRHQQNEIIQQNNQNFF